MKDKEWLATILYRLERLEIVVFQMATQCPDRMREIEMQLTQTNSMYANTGETRVQEILKGLEEPVE